MDLIKEGLIWICLSLDNFVYSLIMFAYQIILVLARINLFEERTALDDFISRVYIIIGVVMLFLLAYSLLRGMINPDEALKGKNSPQKTIFNVLSSVVLIALVPYAFSVAMDFQNAILQQGTLNSIILGSATENAEGSNNINDGGFSIASGIFQAFYHPSTEGNYCQYFGDTKLTESEDCAEVLLLGESYTYDAFWDLVKSTGSFYLLPNTNTDVVDGKIEYNWLISTAVGVFVLVVLVGYCVDIAIRSIKLAVYQLIAPLPILARILPNEQGSKTFSNWLKACISTYLEVFIRLAILFFIVLIITILNDNIGQIFEPFNNGGGVVIGFVAWAFLIVGLIMFMKQLPNIIKEITGLDSGKYGKSLMQGFGMMTASLGGGATAAIRRTVADNREHPEMGRGKRALRTLGALGSGMKSGLWQGRKTEKFGDIPKAAGRAASNTLSHRGNLDSYEGNWAGKRFQYYKQKFSDTAARAKDWAGGSNEELNKLQEVNNNILQVIKGIKDVAEDYIDKHSYEFFADIHDFSDDDQKNIQKLNAQESYYKTRLKNAQDYGNEDDIEAAEVELDRIKKARDSIKGKYRLDILRAKSEDMSISAEERALWRNLYNKSRKVNVDNFATSVKEDPELAKNAQLEAEKVGRLVTTLGEIIKENRGVPSVQYAIGSEVRDGVKAGFTEADLVSNTAEFVKNFKKAAEFSNNDIQGKLDEISRRDARRNNNSKDSGGGSH